MTTKPMKTKRLLIADDNAVTRELLVRLLQPMGVRVDIAVNGNQALKKIRGGYDLILLDWQMPFADGGEILRGLLAAKRRDILDRMAVISGLSGGERLVPPGVKFFPKPFDLVELRRYIHERLA